jgi:hypothetical protein
LNEKAIAAWQRKLDFLILQQARIADAAEKFKLQEDIAEVEEKLRALGARAGSSTPAAPQAAGAVFLSYNHADARTAGVIRKALETGGIAVRIDSKDMDPGEQIREFILKSVGSTSATVCLVSSASLLSGWVALESLLALTVEELWGKRRFIACYLDEDFLDLGFSVKATDIVDRRIAALDKLMEKHRAKRIDTAELNDEKSRLFRLRGGLGEVLARLRGGLCLDVRSRKRAASLEKLVESLRPRNPGAEP